MHYGTGLTSESTLSQSLLLHWSMLSRGHRDGGDEERLAWFLDHKRQVKKKNKLSAKHIQLMETIPDFDW